MQRLLPVFLLMAALAGCLGPPDAPAGATLDADPALPGLELAAWTEERAGRLELHAQVVNHHDEGYWYRVNCGHPWEVELTGPGGPVNFREVLEPAGCAPQHEIMQPRQHISTLYSWDFRDHDASGSAAPVAPGTYEWTIRFTLRDFEETLEARFDVEVPGDPSDGAGEGGMPAFPGPEGTDLEDFVMVLQANGTGPYDVRATVKNLGTASPDFDSGCNHEWAWRILHDADAVSTTPYGTCAGFASKTFPPSHAETFTWSWDGTVYDHQNDTSSPAPPGTYTWEVVFGLHGTGGDTIVGTVDFGVA